METFEIILGWLSLAAWSGLALLRGRFWQVAPVLPAATDLAPCRVTVVIPARNEEEHLAECLESLLQQRIAADLHLIVVDDNSTDRTASLVSEAASRDARVQLVKGKPLPAGWSGKLWAVSQGLEQPHALAAEFLLLTDADILHGSEHLAQLVGAAQREGLEMVSEMVRLRTESMAERATIPAFVFFFAMLYPFRWVSNPSRPEAAAAGGTMLLTGAAIRRVGGMASIRGALIDDVALGREVKRGGHRIWLGHAENALSLRRYPGFTDVWNMVARTAFVQLRFSPLLLAGTGLGMLVLYAAPVALAALGRGRTRRLGLASWGSMALLFQPTLRHYRRSSWWGPALPAIALFYLGATLDSALRHYRGQGGGWKGRVYPQRSADSGGATAALGSRLKDRELFIG